MVLELIADNKEFFILLYAIIMVLICFVIVLKTNRLFKLSFHQGIRYFRNAFFFYGLAFVMRYLLSTGYFFTSRNYFATNIMRGLFEFFLIMAGFSLVYSLLWKKFGKTKSSFFNESIILFYIMAFVIVLLDRLWNTYLLIYFFGVVLFSFAAGISYANYDRKGLPYLKLFFVVMLLNLSAWISNFLASIFEWHQAAIVGTYILNLMVFLLFLIGVIKVTRKSR